jgi:outer membrane protein OmpA-like peptidoglycan-associated protein
MRVNTFGKSTAVFATVGLMLLGSSACATKKYVRQTVNPVEARVTGTEKNISDNSKKISDHSSAIGELENNVSRADEKATEAGKSAAAANQAAERANQAAVEAKNRADAAASMSEQNSGKIGEVDQKFNYLDNYQLVTTEAVLFPTNKATLSREAKEQLDQAVGNIKGNKNYVVEVRGFTDKTGDKTSNIVLSQKRADEVVRYLTTQHDIPLRKIHVLGAGVDQEEQKTRADRKLARKVELKVYSLSLDARTSGRAETSSNATTNQSTMSRPAPAQTAPASR